MKFKKSFKYEDSAREFAKKVNGTVRLRQLPDYNGVIIDWVVEWEESPIKEKARLNSPSSGLLEQGITQGIV